MAVAVQNDSPDRMLLPTLDLTFEAGQSLELDDAVGAQVLAIGAPFTRVALKVARHEQAAAADAPTQTEEPAPSAGQEGS